MVSNLSSVLHIPVIVDERSSVMSYRMTVRELQIDALIPGNILAILDNSIVTISPDYQISFVIVEISYVERK